MRLGRLNKVLNKKYRYNNKIMTLKELIEHRISLGQYVFADSDCNKQKKEEYFIGTKSVDEFQGMNIPKIVYDYFFDLPMSEKEFPLSSSEDKFLDHLFAV